MNFPLIANIIVFIVLLFVLAQARHKQWSLAKSTGRSGHGCRVRPCPAHHLWFRQPGS